MRWTAGTADMRETASAERIYIDVYGSVYDAISSGDEIANSFVLVQHLAVSRHVPPHPPKMTLYID